MWADLTCECVGVRMHTTVVWTAATMSDAGKLQESVKRVMSSLRSDNNDERKAAEKHLVQLETVPGYGVVLCQILANESVELEWRQLAGLLLKAYIGAHWEKGTDLFRPPVTPDGEKAVIRKGLPGLLASPKSKIRTATSMAIAAIASADMPDHWPELMPQLLQFLATDPGQAAATAAGAAGAASIVQGALRCVELMGESVMEVAQALPQLFQALLKILTSAKPYPPGVQMRAIHVYRGLALSLMKFFEDDEMSPAAIQNKLLIPTLSAWLSVLVRIIEPSIYAKQSNHSVGYGVRIEALRTINEFNDPRYYQDAIEKPIGVFIKPVWAGLAGAYNVYTTMMAAGEDDENEVDGDSENDPIGVSAYISEGMDFLVKIMATERLSSKLETELENIAYLAIGYMQISKSEMDEWDDDPAEFAAVEDELKGQCQTTVRANAQKLIFAIEDNYKGKGLAAIGRAASKRIAESAELRSKGNQDWWKITEAALWAVAAVAGWMTAETKDINLGAVVSNLIIPSLSSKNTLVYLRSRALYCVSHMLLLFINAKSDQTKLITLLMQGLQAALAPSEPIPVRIAAAQALSYICLIVLEPTQKYINPAAVQAGITTNVVRPGLIPCLPHCAELMTRVKGDALTSVLLSIGYLVELAPDAFVSLEEKLTPAIMFVWKNNSGDPDVCGNILDLLEDLCKIPKCYAGVCQRTLPTVHSILTNPNQKQAGGGALIDAALKLTHHLLRATEILKQPMNASFLQQILPPVLQIIMTWNARSVLEEATRVLTSFVSLGSAQIATGTMGPNKTPMFPVVMQALTRLLDPSLADEAVVFVGALLTEVVIKFKDQLGAQNLATLMRLSIGRFFTAHWPWANQSFMMFFSRMIHLMGPQFINLVHSMGTIEFKIRKQKQSGGSGGDSKDSKSSGVHIEVEEFALADLKHNALEALFVKWMECTSDVHHSYPTRVCLSALAKLLLFRDARLVSIMVKGWPKIEATGSGPTRPATRGAKKSGASVEEVKYSAVPLTTKILSLLAKTWQVWTKRENAQHKSNFKKLTPDQQKAEAARLGSALVAILNQYSDKTGGATSKQRISPFAPAPANGVLNANDYAAHAAAADAADDGSDGSDDDEYGDEGEDGNSSDEGGGAEYGFLSDILADPEEKMELNRESYPEAETDPLDKIHLTANIRDMIISMSKPDPPQANSPTKTPGPPLLMTYGKLLTQDDQKLVQTILASPAPLPLPQSGSASAAAGSGSGSASNGSSGGAQASVNFNFASPTKK